jgi:MazG family protein
MTVDPNKSRQTLADLLALMAALRAPGSGCPWDLEQDFRTIAPYTIEEAYEVADAIERGDFADLKEELGDLLLQVVYHAQMAKEQRAFDFADVTHAITAKMIRRHPHVFGDAAARSAGAAKGFWERIKAEEKAENARERAALGLAPRTGTSLLDDVPRALPALSRAVRLQSKAAEVGFDWPSLAPVLAKMKEELAELEAELSRPDVKQHRERLTQELGDLLFVMANVARHLGIDPEAALRDTNGKFVRRFRRIEQRLAEEGRTPGQSSLAEMDRLWDEAKAEETG